MTQLGEALARRVERQGKPLLSNYELFRLLWEIYESGDAKYLRGDIPSREVFRRTRSLLRSEGIIRHDTDYVSYWRVLSKSDAPAEDIICTVDPHCYISHMSSMQRYGLTNRRPEALYLTEPTALIRRQMLKAQMASDYGEAIDDTDADVEQAKAVIHPARVRGRQIEIARTKVIGDHTAIKGTPARIATIGQTFLDMLDDPDRCGGMAHILEIWKGHARIYLEEIIQRLDRAEKPILKVRAGYILDEELGVVDPRIETWAALAQRGSSRVLNAGHPFAPVFSEKWMLSLNV